MGRFLLSAMPFTGHVRPVLAVARALVAAGHDVRMYTGSAFRPAVEATGARLVPWRAAPDFDENDQAATFPRVTGRKGLRQLLVNVEDIFIATAPAQVVDLQAEAAREPWDVIAADVVSVGVALHARRESSAWATLSILPVNLPRTDGPPSGMGLTPGRSPVIRMRDAALRAAAPLFSRRITRALDRAQAAVGLVPSHRLMYDVVYSHQLVVASGSRTLDFDMDHGAAPLVFVGELSAPAAPSGPLPSWWGDLDGRTVVHVTQGTQNIDPQDLIRPTIEALSTRDVLVVVASGIPGRDELPFPVPANVRVAGFLPYDALLPRLSAMVTNGGWGGTLAALRQGIPLVIAGGDLDKPEVAARVAWTGAGVNLRTGRPRASRVAAAVDRVLSDPSFRSAAGRIGGELTALGGAPRAAELLTSLVQGAD